MTSPRERPWETLFTRAHQHSITLDDIRDAVERVRADD